MNVRPYYIHALSPLHPGTGQGVGAVDLPIAREKVTSHPFTPGSTVKGVLRAEIRPEKGTPEEKIWFAAFGPDTNHAHEHAGALVFSDARILLLPVRSLRGTFAWVTSPLVLRRYARDLQEVGVKAPAIEEIAQVTQLRHTNAGEAIVHTASKVYLEELDLSAQPAGWVTEWGQHLARTLFPEDKTWQGLLQARLAVVHDDVFDFLSETATQVDTRVHIDDETGTVKSGQLWTEESLPAESILVGLMGATASRRENTQRGPEAMAEVVRTAVEGQVLQMGGKASVGRGRVRMIISSEGEG